MSTLISPSTHFLSALYCLQMAPIRQNTVHFQTLLQNFTQTTLRKWKVQAGENLSVVCHTIFLTITAAIKSWSGPEEMAVMTDRAPSWVRLQKVWVNSLFYGRRCSVPMGTFYQGTHSSQQHLCTIWLTAERHVEQLIIIHTLLSNGTPLHLSWF